MDLQELIQHHKARSVRKREPHRLRNAEYRQHYPLIRDAVQNGVPLHSAITILQGKEGAFAGKKPLAVWQAYRRALMHDGIELRAKEDAE